MFRQTKLKGVDCALLGPRFEFVRSVGRVRFLEIQIYRQITGLKDDQKSESVDS